MLEKIEVGKTYLDEDGDKVAVVFMGKKKLMYTLENSRGEYSESFSPIDFAKENWKDLPKEPRKVGFLHVCTEDTTGGRYIKGELKMISHQLKDDRYWRPVTINEKGEVFSVE